MVDDRGMAIEHCSGDSTIKWRIIRDVGLPPCHFYHHWAWFFWHLGMWFSVGDGLWNCFTHMENHPKNDLMSLRFPGVYDFIAGSRPWISLAPNECTVNGTSHWPVCWGFILLDPSRSTHLLDLYMATATWKWGPFNFRHGNGSLQKL